MSLNLAVVEAGLNEELALHAHGFEPSQVLGGQEVWADAAGALYTREAALGLIRYLVGLGGGVEYPAEWAGPLEGGGADKRQP